LWREEDNLRGEETFGELGVKGTVNIFYFKPFKKIAVL
jgi:hypothetical protein